MTLKTPSSKAFIDEGTLPLGCSSASFWPLSSDVFSTLNEGYASFLSGLVDISIQADSQCVSGLARRSSHQQPLDDLCGCKEDDHAHNRFQLGRGELEAHQVRAQKRADHRGDCHDDEEGVIQAAQRDAAEKSGQGGEDHDEGRRPRRNFRVEAEPVEDRQDDVATTYSEEPADKARDPANPGGKADRCGVQANEPERR